MPTVPEYNTQLAPKVDAAPQLAANATPAAFGAGTGQALANVGQGLDQAASALADHAVRMQQQDNQAWANAAYANTVDTLNSALYDPQNGYFTKNGKDAMDSFVPTRDSLVQSRQDIADSAPNKAAQLLYDADSRRLLASTVQSMSSHAATQRQNYLTQSADAVIEQSVNNAALNNNDELGWAINMGQIHNAVMQKASLAGWSDDQAQVEFENQQSKAWTARLDQMSVTDPVGAQQLFDQNRDKLVGTQQTTVGRALNAAALPQEVRTVYQSVTAGLPIAEAAGAVGPFANAQDAKDRISALVPGAVFTSGLRTPEHNAAVGGVSDSDHLEGRAWDVVPPPGESMAQMYTTLESSGIPWKQILNEGNHIHVAWNAPGAAPIGNQTSTDIRASTGSIVDAVRAAAAAARPDDKVFQDQAETYARSQIAQDAQVKYYQEIQGTNQLVSAVDGGPMGNGPKVTDISQITNDPQLRAAWNSSTPETQRSILGYIKSNVTASTRIAPTPALQQQYESLLTESKIDPEKFAGEDLSKLVGVQPAGVVRSLTNEQIKARDKPQPDANITALLQDKLVQSALATAQIKVPAAGQPADPRFNNFVASMSQNIDTFMSINEHRPNADELHVMAYQNLGQTAPGMKASYFSATPTTSFIGGVPNDDATQIAERLKGATGKVPTGEDIRTFYNAHPELYGTPNAH